MPQADPARGRIAMDRAGCGACHATPGVWPEGRVASSLDAFAERTMIAGRLPNQPEVLVGFIRNAPAYAPEIGMPAMPLTEEEARDVAAYLYSLGDR